MELCVLQHSSASSVEKLDEIARRFPDLAYMLNEIAIEIIDFQQAAEDVQTKIDSLQQQIKDERKDADDVLKQERAIWESEIEDSAAEIAELNERIEAIEKTDAEALLLENKTMLDELDAYKSRHNKMGTADFIEQNEALRTCVHRLAKNMARSASDVNRFTQAYRGKFKDSIRTCTQSMHHNAHDAHQAAFAMPALVTA